MNKHKLFLLPVALLLAFMALACAPPDDDDGPSSGPTINNAIYDFATALLTVQGTNLSPTEAQIQTIVVDGLAFSSYSADAKPTGPDSSGLAEGKYRLKTDGTELWLRLTDDDKTTLESKVGSNGLKKGLLTSTGSWAGLDTAKDLTYIPDKPSKQAEQTEQAEEESPKQAEQAEQQSPKQAEQAEQQSPKQAEQAEQQSPKQAEQAEQQSPKQAEQAEQQSPKQAEQTEQTEQAEQAEQAEQESPKQAEQTEQTEQAEQAEQESPKQAEQTEQTEQAEQAEQAAITGASYHVGTALLTVQGSNLSPTTATQAQIQTIRVAGLAFSAYNADGTATGADSRGLAKGKYRIKSDGTAIWLYLTDDDKDALNGKTGMDSNGLKDGLLTSSGTWAGLDTAKALAVSGNPAITRASYNFATGVLVITGVNLPKAVAGWDFTKLRFVAGNGEKSQPLTRHSPKRTDHFAKGSNASVTSLTITLNGSQKAKADNILVKNGDSDDNGGYNLEAAAGFAGGRAEDTSNNPITVSGYVVTIRDAFYSANKGRLIISGNNLPTTVEGWDFTKLTLVSGDGSNSYTLPRHATAGANTATGSNASKNVLFIILSGTVKAKADAILVKNGKSDNAGAYNLKAAAGFATGSEADPTNAIEVAGVVE